MTISSSSPLRWKVSAARRSQNWASRPRADRFLLDLVHLLGHGMGHQPRALLLPGKRRMLTSNLGPGRSVLSYRHS